MVRLEKGCVLQRLKGMGEFSRVSLGCLKCGTQEATSVRGGGAGWGWGYCSPLV